MKTVLALSALALATLTSAAPRHFHGPPSSSPPISPPAGPPTASPAVPAAPGTVNIQLEIAPDTFTADTFVQIGAVFEIDIMVISATIASVSGVANPDAVTCVGVDQSTQIGQPFSLLNTTIFNNGNPQEITTAREGTSSRDGDFEVDEIAEMSVHSPAVKLLRGFLALFGNCSLNAQE